jgi:hypothetical protein
MATLTHVQCMAAFEHITHTVMEQTDGSPLLKALANSEIDNIYALLCLDQQQIDALEYDDSGTRKFLAVAYRNRVTAFVAYVCHRTRIGTPIGTDYLSVTADEFDEYRGTAYLVDRARKENDPEMNDPSVADFLDGIRRASNLFRSPIVCDNKEDVVENNNKEDKVVEAEETAETNVIKEREAIPEESDFFTRMRHHENLVEVLKELKNRGDDSNVGEENDEEEGVIWAEETAKENVPRESEQPDLKEKSDLAVKEHGKELGWYYDKTNHYEEYKPKVFFVEKLWRPDPPSPEPPLLEPPSVKPPPEPPPPERL